MCVGEQRCSTGIEKDWEETLNMVMHGRIKYDQKLKGIQIKQPHSKVCTLCFITATGFFSCRVDYVGSGNGNRGHLCASHYQ